MKRLTLLAALAAALLIPGLTVAAEGDAPTATRLLEQLESLQSELDRQDASPEPNLEVLREQREQAARDLQAELDRIEEEIQVALAGVEDGAFDTVVEEPPTDLQAELAEFVKPFLVMLRSATAESRQLEEIRRELADLEKQRAMANDALERLAGQPALLDSAGREAEIAARAADAKTLWSGRLAATEAQIAALESQIEEISEGTADRDERGPEPTTFLRDRAITLLLGVGAAVAAWIVLSLIGAALFRSRRQQSSGVAAARISGWHGPSVAFRALRLLYRMLTGVTAVVAALAVFNARNDWLLLGLGVIVLVGVLWTIVQSLPDSIELVRLLLNLGSVQEGERLMFDGIPWRVAVLDFHSVLENPLLEGGDLALPARDLSSHYSRPVAPSEAWFPTETGDWVLLDDDKIARVEVQTPGNVTLRRLGGGTVVVPSSTFVEEPPMNLSHGFRVELEFGIDYTHRAEATTTILETMRRWIEERLPAHLPPDSIRGIEVEFFAAAASSLNYEIEVDLDGAAAAEYEEVGRILSRLLVDCCNEHGWKIPFPQLQVHSSS